MIEIRAHQDPLRARIGFYVLDRQGEAVAVASPLTMRTVREGEATYVEPTFGLKPDECQALMDELWRVGFRPSEGSGSAGAMSQAEAHIASLKAIAFKLAGIN